MPKHRDDLPVVRLTDDQMRRNDCTDDDLVRHLSDLGDDENYILEPSDVAEEATRLTALWLGYSIEEMNNTFHADILWAATGATEEHVCRALSLMLGLNQEDIVMAINIWREGDDPGEEYKPGFESFLDLVAEAKAFREAPRDENGRRL